MYLLAAAIMFNQEAIAAEVVLKQSVENLKGWKIPSAVKRVRDPKVAYVLQIPAGQGIKRQLDISPSKGDLLVVRAYIKGENLVLGNKPYKTGKIALHTKAEDSKIIRTEERFTGTFDWRYAFHTIKPDRKNLKFTLLIRNEASEGDLYLRKVSVYLCKREELHNFDYPVEWKDVIGNAVQAEVDVKVKNKEWEPVRREIAGFDIGYPLRMGSYSPSAALSDPQISDLASTLLRFPGGIKSNFYHAGTKRFNTSDLIKFPRFNNDGFKMAYGHNPNKPDPMNIDGVVKWAHNTGTPVSLVLNVVTAASIEDTLALIKYFRKGKVQIKSLELGNELYFKAQGGDVIKTPKDYFKHVSPVIARIRQEYPNLPVGIPIDHKINDWNSKIREMDIDFDACILHPYINTSNIATVGGDSALIRYATDGLQSVFNDINTRFPEKRIWITEWNFEDEPYSRLARTATGVLFSANALLTFFDTPSADLAAYFSIFAPHLGIVEISKDGGLLPRSPIYDFWLTTSSIIRSSTKTALIAIDTTGVDKTSSDIQTNVRIRAFSDGKRYYLLVVNNNRSPVVIRIADPSGNEECKLRTISLVETMNRNEGAAKRKFMIPPISASWIGPANVLAPVE